MVDQCVQASSLFVNMGQQCVGLINHSLYTGIQVRCLSGQVRLHQSKIDLGLFSGFVDLGVQGLCALVHATQNTTRSVDQLDLLQQRWVDIHLGNVAASCFRTGGRVLRRLLAATVYRSHPVVVGLAAFDAGANVGLAGRAITVVGGVYVIDFVLVDPNIVEVDNLSLVPLQVDLGEVTFCNQIGWSLWRVHRAQGRVRACERLGELPGCRYTSDAEIVDRVRGDVQELKGSLVCAFFLPARSSDAIGHSPANVVANRLTAPRHFQASTDLARGHKVGDFFDADRFRIGVGRIENGRWVGLELQTLLNRGVLARVVVYNADDVLALGIRLSNTHTAGELRNQVQFGHYPHSVRLRHSAELACELELCLQTATDDRTLFMLTVRHLNGNH